MPMMASKGPERGLFLTRTLVCLVMLAVSNFNTAALVLPPVPDSLLKDLEAHGKLMVH